jgi:hypothetical protein
VISPLSGQLRTRTATMTTLTRTFGALVPLADAPVRNATSARDSAKS